ncbi:recombinase family protein [Halobacillus halophilus]|uniref:recombinase family protein n=1 Tax=Halobacillus halophilus TaxID=1570 RepID=UPI001CD1AA1E|nr:recombinase family protein [Halobacillus halophilus]MCA1010379.1 recombinase family protein [Halobacillus halophilus]
MEKAKLHVFFRRVSTKGQDITIQEAADLYYREKLQSENIMIINENAISANKKSINERPEMQKLISLITKNKVSALYAFDRSRLFRDHYEGMEFNDLRLAYNVKLIYTSTGNGHIQASNDIFVEGLLNMFSDIEGKNIARRSEETRRRYPPQIMGYKKDKDTKTYSKDPNKKEYIDQYFTALTYVNTIDELRAVVKEYQKNLNCSSELSLINMASNPFYAAYDLEKGTNRLSHVDPYITLETFNQLQETKSELFKTYVKQVEQQKLQVAMYAPICGYCKKRLNYRHNKDSNQGFFTCSRKEHAKNKVKIPFSELEKVIDFALQEIVHKLDYKLLSLHSVKSFKKIKDQTEAEISAINSKIKELTEEIVLSSRHYSEDWKNDHRYKKVNSLKMERRKLLEEITLKEEFLQNNKKLSGIVQSYLSDRSKVSSTLLYSLFINQVFIYEDEVDIEVFTFNYLRDLHTEMIYVGDESAWN